MWVNPVLAWPAATFTVQPATAMFSLSSALQFAENIGLPVEEGIFGFKPFAEVARTLLPLLWLRATHCSSLCCALF